MNFRMIPRFQVNAVSVAFDLSRPCPLGTRSPPESRRLEVGTGEDGNHIRRPVVLGAHIHGVM